MNENQPPIDADPKLEIIDWGLIEYKECEEKQLQILRQIHENNSRGALIICTHPETVTLGRASQERDVQGWSGPIFEVKRGGRATYHGPEQIVIYTLINLKYSKFDSSGNLIRAERDVAQLLRGIEKAAIACLATLGIAAHGKTNESGDLNDTGVWVGSKKIMSLGIAVSQWISYHGLAFNFSNNPNAFRGISPCGFSQDTMISLENLLPTLPSRREFQQRLIESLDKNL